MSPADRVRRDGLSASDGLVQVVSVPADRVHRDGLSAPNGLVQGVSVPQMTCTAIG